ncbi:family 1 glycosylhydrolase [Microbacterium aurantiacum]|uniref:Beta-glucosidase n=1 Tax=Microbacterium aurantiacum TaxID=162393 RepID=A0A0M8MEA8_9MICO|nr:family 1 glycosylhydrolase [Microbacterium chocolatum]ANG84552.1 beta-glucosidase [Microbacterium chocolatum]KOS09688.1 beta-glucosidase [Microbacterium chocolatum]
MIAFPDTFIWGTATAAHQTEGGNVSSDWWHLEHQPDSPCAEPSGDACDSYHRYSEDIAIVKSLGLSSYRFSLEWARIEPEPGEYSRAQLEHYKRMIGTVLDSGLIPNVTLQHFTVPQWFKKAQGWARPDAADIFARYCEQVVPILNDVDIVCTINEPNIATCLWGLSRKQTSMQTAGLPDPNPAVSDGLTASHERAKEILKCAGVSEVGWAVATLVFEAEPGAEEITTQHAYERETRFIEAARTDDWLGVQAYTRQRIGIDGPLTVPADAEKTLTGWEYFPDAAYRGLKDAAALAPGVPLHVTENGIATDNDQRRIDYIEGALQGIHRAISEGIDVRSYYYWSLLDNYEWASGYGPTFGMVQVNRSTFERTLKPSAKWFSSVVHANGVTSR